jgi:tetratricopeptide (TPR) repeat protein
LEIDNKLAEAHSSLAAILINSDRDWKGAEDQFRRAVELNANYATAHNWYSVLLLTVGRLESAVEEAEKARLLDPLSPVIGMGVVQAYLFSERYDKAIDECRRYLDIDPNFIPTHDFLVHLYVHKGMFEEALKEAQRMIDLSEIKVDGKAHLAYAYATSGKAEEAEEARRLIREAVTDPKVEHSNPTMIITVYSILGDQDKAFEWAERVFKSQRLAFPTLRFSPDLKQFRDDARYRALLMKAGLELYM